MAPSRLESNKLTDYLAQLSPEVAMFLIREIEHQRAGGKDDNVYDRVLGSARAVVRSAHLTVERRTSPKRLFCEPFQDLLFDDERSLMQKGRICRRSINRIWSWLTGGHAPLDLNLLSKEFETQAKRGDQNGADALGQQILERAADSIEQAIETTSESTKAKTRLEAILGGPGGVFDAGEMAIAIRAAPAIYKLRQALPAHLEEFDTASVEATIGPVEECIGSIPNRPEFAFATLITRLAVPAQALRFAIHRVDTDSAGRLAVSPYAGLGALVLHDLHDLARKVDDLVRDRESAASILYAVSCYHGSMLATEQELDIPALSPWGKTLSSTRRLASDSLDSEIRKIPGQLSTLMKPRSDIKPGGAMPWPDSWSVSETERAFALLAGSRPFLDQLSLNEAIAVTEQSITDRLNLIADQILNDLRHFAGTDKQAAQAWLETMISLIGIASTKTDAELLERSGVVAAQVGGLSQEVAEG